MAAHRGEEEELTVAKANLTPHCSDSEEDEVEDQNWDDWEVEDDAEEEQGSNTELRCLFCDSPYNSSSSLFEHCASVHHFDFYGIKKAYSLDFYRCFKLINYIRCQTATNKCWSCGKMCDSKEELQNHLHEERPSERSILPWDDEKYLNPFLQDDALLYSFDEDDEYEDEDDAPVDSEELAIHLSQFEHINIDDEGSSDRYASELMQPCANGAKEVQFTVNESANHVKSSGMLVENGVSTVTNGMLSFQNTENIVSSSKVAANEITNINKKYFGSYSSFGIHRDMISDKVRTDAYRQAILENPSLLRGSVVMDVGCGTGILSLFAAQAGAARVISVEASEKMAEVATQIAKDNGLLRNGLPGEDSQCNGVIEVVQGMVEELPNADHIKPHSVDVLLSEWMGYCLLYESMLSSVLFARDRWLKPGGAILPDTATMFVAGFGRGGTSIPFWEDVYGFNMSCIGREVVEDAARVPIVDVIDSCNIVTTTKVLQSFDLATMHPKQMDFTSEVELEPNLDAALNHPAGPKLEITWCYGVVLWFDTGFSERFCTEKPVNLSTSPYGPSTHWSQTILTFREPIAMASKVCSEKLGVVGTVDCPAARIESRISIVRAAQHRSIDISMELTGIGADGRKHSWPVQMFNLN